MVVLTDLPDELLLPIVADVSPLYIEHLALSCKRLYGLCADVIREHDRVRSELPTKDPPSCQLLYNLLQRLFQKPSLAEYPTSWSFNDSIENHSVPEHLVDEINIHAQREPYAYLFDTEHPRPPVAELLIPFAITQLVNVRKIRIHNTFGPWRCDLATTSNAPWAPYLIEFMAKIIKTSHEPNISLQEPSILGRLKEAEIISRHASLAGTELPLLLSMLPTLRKLHVFGLERRKPYVCPHEHRVSGITDMLLDGQLDSEYIVELINRTKSLHSFTYSHLVNNYGVFFEPSRLLTNLKERAGQSLTFLCLVTSIDSYWTLAYKKGSPSCRDLSMGSLREFKVLKYLVTGVEMFVKTRGGSQLYLRKGTQQRLVSWLPASLETLVVVERLGEWEADILRMLFRGFRTQKQLRLPNLKNIKFYDFNFKFHGFDQVMFNAIREACRETGVTMSYIKEMCENCRSYCNPPKSLQDWEDHDWIEDSEDLVKANKWR
ncbi:hypothetical protein BDR22DRAFT_964852 [Usnea florida]